MTQGFENLTWNVNILNLYLKVVAAFNTDCCPALELLLSTEGRA